MTRVELAEQVSIIFSAVSINMIMQEAVNGTQGSGQDARDLGHENRG